MFNEPTATAWHELFVVAMDDLGLGATFNGAIDVQWLLCEDVIVRRGSPR
jgi:hypothetical protein